ncbi:2463_t:CDS:2 [Entrophospora sp. SA101]|nr:2463_t:CDS:2 [Entrophospora sp. SA101]
MARNYLAISASSIPVERIFSGGTGLITSTRCSLSGKEKAYSLKEIVTNFTDLKSTLATYTNALFNQLTIETGSLDNAYLFPSAVEKICEEFILILSFVKD